MAVALLGSTAASAADGNRAGGAALSASAATAEATVQPSAHAERPRFMYGGWMCPPRFVWRNAGNQDWLCVSPAEAQRIALENRQAPETWVEAADGTHNCRAGLVPRQAFKGDPVCVDPRRREAVRAMNLALLNDI
jgi:hypothetical protein